MSDPQEDDAKRKCIHEAKALIHRWEDESDLESEDIVACVAEAVDEYYEEEIVEFDCDMDLDGEED